MLVDDLPASALRFPLAIESSDGGTTYVRTVLAVDEDMNTMTFAGDVPVGWSARLMRTTTERLVDGAAGAAAATARSRTVGDRHLLRGSAPHPGGVD